MSVAGSKRLSRRRIDYASRFVVLFVAMAFALQSYITQTHIHGLSRDFGAIAKIATTKAPGQDKTPAGNDQTECQLCQAITHSGVFVAAATLTLHLPFSWVKMVPLVFSARVDSYASAHNWQSRAPPLL